MKVQKVSGRLCVNRFLIELAYTFQFACAPHVQFQVLPLDSKACFSNIYYLTQSTRYDLSSSRLRQTA